MSKKKHIKHPLFRKKGFLFLTGLLVGGGGVLLFFSTSHYLSKDSSCMLCHIHPHVEGTWKQSVHYNNESGTRVKCVECHLPPQDDMWQHYKSKMYLGIKDAWGMITKDSAQLDWEYKSQLENAVKYIPNSSCMACHHNLLPQGISDDGITAHLYYEENEKKLNLQCISCHLDVGHYNPNYTHSKLAGIPTSSTQPQDTSLFFKQPTPVSAFETFNEQIPGTMVSFKMVAIPEGSFKMGSDKKEDFHQADEAPVHEVRVSRFFMGETEVTWDQYWAFYAQTMSEGRTPPELIYANNSRPDVDAISGPTPPFGFPDQGWGGGSRPAITMTHYAAEIFCQWLSKKTGKKYRLPTEAEWEYAARGGAESPYFFAGDPSSFSEHGFWRRFFKAKEEPISQYVIYAGNSHNKTQEPTLVAENPFGLKNMLGNVYEYCADKYKEDAYAGRTNGVTDPLCTEGEEWVVRGGNYLSDASEVRCASRSHTEHDSWLKTDPQQPKSIWWYSDIRGIGFRVVCEWEE